jgi:hypothetical protein
MKEETRKSVMRMAAGLMLAAELVAVGSLASTRPLGAAVLRGDYRVVQIGTGGVTCVHPCNGYCGVIAPCVCCS